MIVRSTRHFAWLGLMLLLVGPTVVHAQSSASFEALIADGDRVYNALQNKAAITRYKDAHALRPNDFGVLWRLSRTYNDVAQDYKALGNEEAAEENFELASAYADSIIANFPERREGYFHKAAAIGNLALFKGGKEKVKYGRDVEYHCKKALEIDPNYDLALVAYGIFQKEVASLSWVLRRFAKLLFGGLPDASFEEAASLLERAIASNPSITIAYYELGQVYRKLGRKADARRVLEQSLQLEPNNTEDIRNQAEARKLLAKL